MPATSAPLSESHKRQLIRIALVPAVASPLVLYGIALAARANGWDVVGSARAAAMITMFILAGTIFAPLFLNQPSEQRKRGFVIFWFLCAAFFNVVWQVPLILFQDYVAIDASPHTYENLFKFIHWWGYGFADHHYGKVTSWMMSEELWFLISIGLSVYGLILLRRGGDEARAFLWMGIGGATQSYNASLYIFENGLVDRFSNIPDGSIVSLILYWGFNPLWAIAALLASIFCFQFVLARTEKNA